MLHTESTLPFQNVLMPAGIRSEQHDALILPGNVLFCWNQRIVKIQEHNPVTVIVQSQALGGLE